LVVLPIIAQVRLSFNASLFVCRVLMRPTVFGHTHYIYPIGTPLLALPFVWVANLLGFDMARPADDGALQNVLSALSVAVLLLLCYRLCRYWLDPPSATMITTSFVFGTIFISTMASALWSMNASILLTLGCLVLLLKPGVADSVGRGLAIGVLLGVAYICRPTIVTFAIPLLAYMAFNSRRTLLGVLSGGGALLACFVGYSLWQYGTPLPVYYSGGRFDNLRRPLMALIALVGHVISPGRGILLWSPQLIVVFVALLLCFARLRHAPLFWFAVGWAAVHLALVSAWTHWWGGSSFGNRLFIDAIPALLLLTILVWYAVQTTLARQKQGLLRVSFVLFSAFGIAINSGQGLFNPATNAWHFYGDATVDQYPMMLFDWRYPQFLASDAGLKQRASDYLREPLPPNTIWDRPVWPISQLLVMKAWRPQGLVAGSNMAPLLDDSWYWYEPAWRARWMRGFGRIWIATDRPNRALLRLLPASINTGGKSGEQGTLRVLVNGAHAGDLSVTVENWAELPITIAPWSTEIRLELLTGESYIGTDPRLLGAAFHQIEIVPQP
jgi:hypothetical protein